MGRRNPTWSREELILALDLYFKLGCSKFSSSHPEVIALSELLNKLSIHKDRPDAATFRNPNGVSMKLSNFLRLDPSYTGTGLERGGKLEESIWDEFATDRQKLSRAAQKVRASIAD